MSTRVLKAQDEKITDEMVEVAKSEGICEKFLKDSIAKGHIVILKNKIRKEEEKNGKEKDYRIIRWK